MKKYIHKTENKQNPAREALRRLSAQIRARLNATGSARTINEVLEAMYRAQSGQNDFDTFHGWKERGYCVEKGAKGYPVWSRPKSRNTEANEMTKTETPDGVEVNLNGGEKKAPSFWVSYLFHAGQVIDENGERPNTYGQTPRVALPVPHEFKRDMDIIQPPEKPAIKLSEFEIMDEAEEVPQGAKEAQAEFVW